MLAPHRPASSFALALAAALAFSAPTTAQKDVSEAAQQKAAFLSSAPWQTFLADVGGEWSVDWCAATGSPGAIWGSGVPLADWRVNSLEEARRHAHALLRERSGLLGLGDSEFREVIGARMSRVWTFTFDQFFRGIPVLEGRADVRVHMVGRVPMFGAKAWRIPADFDVVPSFDADTALAIAWQQAGAPTGAPQPAPVAAPRLVIWADVHATAPQTPRLYWEVAISNVDAEGNGPIGRHYVDASTGAYARFQTDKHECGFAGCTIGAGDDLPATASAEVPDASSSRPVTLAGPAPVNTTVTVRGWTRTGVDAYSWLVNTPLPGLVLNVPGIGAVTTDDNGQCVINIASPVTIPISALDGRHHGAIAGPNAPTGSFTVSPGVATTIQLLTVFATTNQAAHTTAAYWTDRVNEWARSILGNTAELNTASNVGVTVNIAATCNAYYYNNTTNFYRAEGCSNTATSTIIGHEWGHGLDDRYGGISNDPGIGLSEGWADIIGCYLLDTPDLGSGFYTAGVALRSGNNTTQYPCSGCGPHTAGQSWMGFAWKLRDRLTTTLGTRAAAIALTEQIVIGTIVADATDQPGALLEVYLADDNDGNLANGTPHKADLDWACHQHALPIPGNTTVNDDCAAAIPVVNGMNGPFSTIGATASGPSWPCATNVKDIWFTYVVHQAGTLTVSTCGLSNWDTAVQILGGPCGPLQFSLACDDNACGQQSTATANVTPGTYRIRVGGSNGAAGTFRLDVNGPAYAVAAATPFGSGCYRRSRSFYESFPQGSFDLASSAMRLAYDATGFYTASATGGYVAPSAAATVLALSDDGLASVSLASPLPYPGGVTSTLQVCANGFVSAATGNGNGYAPSVAAWLASPQARWGCWHDFNPSAVGSGQVKFEQVGNVSYVTWDGVYSFGTTSPATFQLQFDRSDGAVTYAWGPVTVAGNGWLVGFAAPGPGFDIGNRDLSAMLPATFATDTTNLAPLTLAGTTPTLGSTLTLTTTNFTASAPVGVQILGVTRVDPGVDLAPLGMPGCFQHASPTALYTINVASGSATYTMAIPNDPTLMGFQMFAQTLGFAIGANTAGLVTSNGVALTVGV